MHIHGTSHVHGPHGINPPHAPFRGQASGPSAGVQGSDRVEISPAAEAAVRAAETGEVRHELVNQIRDQIAAGTYETAEKLDIAVARLLDEIG
jgi:negative regulator of flagellin synthesis FlgM